MMRIIYVDCVVGRSIQGRCPCTYIPLARYTYRGLPHRHVAALGHILLVLLGAHARGAAEVGLSIVNIGCGAIDSSE